MFPLEENEYSAGHENAEKLWQQNAEVRASGVTPPVFIVVCNNTNVSKLVFDFIGGWEKQIGEKRVAQAGQLAIFRNDFLANAALA
jgi:type III restriction enzyme